jgi:23S rRNA maturation-related 3'-5' exoribonuclease YhaM
MTQQMAGTLTAYIADERFKEFTELGLFLAPLDFWTLPAARNREYHLRSSHGMGGLFRHTQAALYVCSKLIESQSVMRYFSPIRSDVVYSALCLHDIMKPSGKHALEVEGHLASLEEKFPEEYHSVIPLIRTHMGLWLRRKKNHPAPRTSEEVFVHLCDYIASLPQMAWFDL